LKESLNRELENRKLIIEALVLSIRERYETIKDQIRLIDKNTIKFAKEELEIGILAYKDRVISLFELSNIRESYYRLLMERLEMLKELHLVVGEFIRLGGWEKDFVELEDKYIKDLGIKLETVRRDYVGRTIKAPAEVKENPLLSATVTSPVEGIVKEIFVKEGDRVKKGDTIALIYSPRIVELKADLEIAEVKLETAKRIYERDKQLYEQKELRVYMKPFMKN